MSSPDTGTQDTLTPISEQAAYWWVTLRDGDCTAAEQRAFAEWVTRSPERVEAYLRMVSFMAKLRSRDLEWPDDTRGELIAAGKAAGAEIVHLPRPIAGDESPAPGLRRMRLRGPLVAAAVLSLVVVAAWLYLVPPQRYQTGPGEHRTVPLADGSLATLDPSTAIDVDFGRDRRLVRIPGGRVLFQVAHEAARPFEVMDERVTVRALGTRFHVDCRRAQTTITVLEGSVLVELRGRKPGSTGGGSEAADPEGTPSFVLDATEQLVVQQSGHTSLSRVPGVRTQTTGKGYRLSTNAHADGDGEERQLPPPGVQQILPRGRILAVFDPRFVPVAEASIPDDAWVLGVVVEGIPKAYSLNLLNRHEVVNDRSGNTDFAAVW